MTVEEAVGDITKVKALGDVASVEEASGDTPQLESSSPMVSLCFFINDESLTRLCSIVRMFEHLIVIAGCSR